MIDCDHRRFFHIPAQVFHLMFRILGHHAEAAAAFPDKDLSDQAALLPGGFAAFRAADDNAQALGSVAPDALLFIDQDKFFLPFRQEALFRQRGKPLC